MSVPCVQGDTIRDIQKELTLQGKENSALQTKTDIMDKKIDGLHEKMDRFIETADTKYATKGEVDQIRKHIGNEEDIKKKNRQEQWKFWGIIISALLSLAGVVVGVLLNK